MPGTARPRHGGTPKSSQDATSLNARYYAPTSSAGGPLFLFQIAHAMPYYHFLGLILTQYHMIRYGAFHKDWLPLFSL